MDLESEPPLSNAWTIINIYNIIKINIINLLYLVLNSNIKFGSSFISTSWISFSNLILISILFSSWCSKFV